MNENQEDVVVAGETVGRLVYNGRDYQFFALDPRLRAIDQQHFDTASAAREAVLVTLDAAGSDAD